MEYFVTHNFLKTCKQKLCYTVCVDVKWCSCYGKQHGVSQKTLKTKLPYDLAILLLVPLLGIYKKELKSGSQSYIYTPMCIAVLFTIVKLWKQPKYPLTDKWIKKIWYIHTVEYYFAF